MCYLLLFKHCHIHHNIEQRRCYWKFETSKGREGITSSKKKAKSRKYFNADGTKQKRTMRTQ